MCTEDNDDAIYYSSAVALFILFASNPAFSCELRDDDGDRNLSVQDALYCLELKLGAS